MSKKYKQIAFIVIAGCILAVFVAIGLLNPDLTPQRMLIKYWPVYLAGAIVLIGAYWLVDK